MTSQSTSHMCHVYTHPSDICHVSLSVQMIINIAIPEGIPESTKFVKPVWIISYRSVVPSSFSKVIKMSRNSMISTSTPSNPTPASFFTVVILFMPISRYRNHLPFWPGHLWVRWSNKLVAVQQSSWALCLTQNSRSLPHSQLEEQVI